ncbi:hypothetical protein A9Q93_01260 [Nonlabens dokdonensis]|uniref:Uncharacterized protein n=1 Tax=Nonlabens dokdonensis TaxID=328515 RepID=A0A1Z8BF62_9FLAO|nr:hypothetical protein [Nonlabens dokdonensis]OUS21233.1 hypothetical protein A9Q93_01260 [Nonlabens dokdonensis]
MGVATKHLLDKIDRIRARGDQRRADRIADARTGSIATYKSATKKRVFTAEQIEKAKAQFRNNLKKDRWIVFKRILFVFVILPLCLWLFMVFLNYFN